MSDKWLKFQWTGHKHIVFVFDESGSMTDSWGGVVDAYRKYVEKRKQSQSDSDLVSVVQFDGRSRITVNKVSTNGVVTRFHPAASDACNLARATPASHIPAIVFMSDGGTGDAPATAREFSLLNDYVSQKSSDELELRVIVFGAGSNQAQLQQIAGASRSGKVHASANTADLSNVFVSIAATQNVATLLESEIAKQISEAASDKLSLEFLELVNYGAVLGKQKNR
ncbi:hypothetical protein ACHAXR_012275 [Thalassiosira sp. AJA248-18]